MRPAGTFFIIQLSNSRAYTVDGFNVTFKNAGTYYLVAKGNDGTVLVPAVAKVTVEDKEAVKNYLADLRVSFDAYTGGGTDPSIHLLENGGSEYTLVIPANQTNIFVGYTLSEYAPVNSTVTATYMNAYTGTFQTQTVPNFIPGGNIGMLPNFVNQGMEGTTVTFTVGAGEDIQTYEVICTRVPAITTVLINDADGNALTALGDVYLVPENMETVQITAYSYGGVLTINGQEAENTVPYNFTPVWDENNKCIVELKATAGELVAAKSFVLQLYKEGDTLSGSCGENAIWEFSGSTLTISGTGQMAAYDGWSSVAPWAPLQSKIETIVVKGGITNVSAAFSSYENLKKVVLEEGVKSIEQTAFSYCTELKEITLPSGLETIGRQAFRNCGLTSVIIPASVTSVGNYAFQNCASMESAEIYGAVSSSMFAGCTSLKNVVYASNSTEIPQQVFQGCIFESFVIPEGVTVIADYAFQNCTELKSVTIPSTVTELRATQFDGCSSLAELKFSGDSYKLEDSVLYSGDGTTIIMCLKDITGELVIPEGVTTIGADVFANKSMTSVKFPSTLTTIKANAFMGCPNLEKVELPDSVTSVDINTFSNCPALKEVKLSEGMTELANAMFFKCGALEKVTLPDSLTAIGVNVFFECKSLKEMVFPANVITMGNQVLAYCSSLTSVTLPEKLTTMGTGLFAGCTSLTSISIPEGVSVIPDSAFSQCTSLEELILPSTLKSFNGNYVFNSTEGLKTIYFRGSAEQWAAVTGGKPAATVEVVYYYGRTDVPFIEKQPQDTICGQNEDAVNALSVTAKEPEEGITLTYVWYYNTTDSNADGTLMESTVSEDGLTSYCTPMTEETGTTYYYCVLSTSKDGEIIASVPTETAKIEVVAGKWNGEGTQDAPYELSSANDLQTLYDFVAEGKDTAGLYFKFTEDITLPDGWKPIGKKINESLDSIMNGENLYPFSGIIDGNGKTVTVPEGGLPLLGYVKGAEVKNLNIYGKKIAGYGLVNNYEGVGLSGSAIVIDNVTLKSGSSTLKSGLIGAEITENGFAGVSAAFVATIRNCIVEGNVVIGYDKNQSNIGSIAGRMQGTVENCVSYATVYGTDYVGGIIANRDNALGQCSVSDSKFHGNVEASGKYAGGIAGGVYTNTSAPNGNGTAINNCTVTGNVTGADRVGGILGGDGFTAQKWGTYSFKKNSFTGKVNATAGTYVGGIIGYYNSLNICDDISGNYYASGCGADKGIGFVKYVDTSCETHEIESGAQYFSTKDDIKGCPEVTGCHWQTGHDRKDDPLGKDAAKLCYSDNTGEAVATELVISGDFSTDIVTGSELKLDGIILTVHYNNGDTKEITWNDVVVTGFDSSKLGEQKLTLAYGSLAANITVKVMNAADAKVKVTFTLLGDKLHDADSDGEYHTWKDGSLETWIAKTTYEFTGNATILDILEQALKENGMSCRNEAGNYVQGITRNGVELAEFDNGRYSGWMYKLNGKDSDLSVIQQYLKDGDDIVFHYTDYYPDDSSRGNEDETLKPQPHVHSWDAGTVTKPATCKETGIKTFKCSCGETTTETIEKSTDHTYGEWTTVTEATVKVAEVQKRICSVCGNEDTNTGNTLTPVLEVPGKLNSFNIKKGETDKFTVTMAEGDSVVSVKSSKKKFLKASLNEKTGKITLKGVKKGTSKLTITLESGMSRTYTVKVVTGTVKTTGLSVTNVTDKKLTLAAKKTYTLKSEVKPFTSTQKLTYKSSNKKVATVSASGKIKAVAPGKATITVTSGKKKVKIAVTVPGITNVKASVSVKKNKTLTLKPKTFGISEKVTFTSSKPKVATVTANGKIKGIKKGTAKITIKAGTFKKTVTVKVK